MELQQVSRNAARGYPPEVFHSRSRGQRAHGSRISHNFRSRSYEDESDIITTNKNAPKNKKQKIRETLACLCGSYLSPNHHKPQMKSKSTETINRFDDEHIEIDVNTRQEFYRFDHGESDQYHTTDHLPNLKSDKIANDVQQKYSIFWAEAFGYINVVVAFLVTFFIQFFR